MLSISWLTWEYWLIPKFVIVPVSIQIILPLSPFDFDTEKHFLCLYYGGNGVFLKSAWQYNVIDYYDKTRNTPYFSPWPLGDKLGVLSLTSMQLSEEVLQISQQILKNYDWK